MKTFFQSFFGALLAIFVFCILCVFVFFGIVAALSTREKTVIASKAVLVIDLSIPFKEQQLSNPFAELTGDPDAQLPSLYDVIRLVRYAKTDPNVKGIYLKSNINSNGFASSEALRRELEEFRNNNKFIIAYADYYSQGAYYVASVANKVYCNPQGMVEWKGMAVELTFIKNTLKKLEIEPQIFYAGKFKSATEPLREEKMTDANRLQTSVLLEDIYENMLSSIASDRKLDTAMLRQIANTMTIQKVEDAVKYKLIDAAKYDDEVKAEIREKLGLKKDEKINFITTGKYNDAVNISGSSKNKIAVLYAAGEIVYGRGEEDEIASDEFKKLISRLRTDNDIKAVVLRVNSPGGSSLASDIIWRELELLKKEKPLIVSMGNYAASGGYYISCNADSIFAEPNTLTGSIGVFSVVPNVQGLMNNKLGVTFDGVKTGEFSDFPTITRPMTAAEKQFMQNMTDQVYNDFKTRVAEGRHKTVEYIDSIAQGRVWTGERAVEIGLADRLGSLDDALKAAAAKAGLKDFKVREYPEQKSFFERFFTNQSSHEINEKIKTEIGEENFKVWKELKRVRRSMGSVQARLPFEFNFN